MSVPQSPVDARHGGDSRIPRPSSLTSPMTSPVPLRRAGSLRLRGEKGFPSSAPLSSPRQKLFPTISESSTASPRHHRSLQSLTPRRPSISASPNPADDDDNDSIRSFGSTQSACDHAHFARNGTTFSGRRMKYVVHCSPQHETEEYLTPTQRAARQERRLKALLAQSRRDLETKDECIFRLTKEVVELRLLRGDAPPEISVTETAADATDSRSRQTASQWTKSNGFGDVQSPVADSAWGCHNGGAGDGPSSGLVTPVSLSDSGHFDDALTAAAISGSSPSSALALDERRALLEHLERRLEEQARRHEERALEDRRALVEQYERKMEEMSRRHAAQTQEERRELESAYGKRLMEAARALAEEKDKTETALRERDVLKINGAQGGVDTVPAGLEKRLADALQRLQALQRSPTKEVKSTVEVDCNWNETSIQRVEEALANLEKRIAEERSKREEALKSVHNLSEEIGALERRLAGETELRSVALEEAEKLRESDLMNSVRVSDLERRLDEELRIREENEGNAEALRERIRLNEARLADLEARLTDEIKRREEALRKIEELNEVLSLKEVRLAELECTLSNEILTKQDLRSETEELRETVRLRTSQIRQLEERVISERTEGKSEAAALVVQVMHLQKKLAEEQLLRDKLTKNAEDLRPKVATYEPLGEFKRRLADEQIGYDNERKESNQVVDKAETEGRICSEQRIRTEAVAQPSQLEELERRLVEEHTLREESVREVKQLRATSLQMADLEREVEENKLIRDEALREAIALREKLDSSEAQQEELERRIREDRAEVQALREAAAVQSSRLVDLERKLAEEQHLREEIAEESKLSRVDCLQLTELKTVVEEEKLLREEAISQGLELQERLKISEAERSALQKKLEEERKRQKEATSQGMALQERLILSEDQRAELEGRFEEERRLREESINQGVALQERLELTEIKQAELQRNFEQRLQEEVVSQGVALQRRLELSEAQQVDFRKSFEEEQRLRDEAIKEAEEAREVVSLLSSQLAELQRRFAAELTRQQEADGVRSESLKEWETRLTDLTLALEEEQRRADCCQSQLDQFRANVQNASDVSQDLESRLALATQTAEALEKDFGERLKQAEQRCKELEAERNTAAERIEELSNALKEQEERHKDINLEMYQKGQEAAKFERRDEVMLHAQAAPTTVAVPELLAQLESTEKELDKLKESKIEKVELLSSTEAVGLFLVASFKAMYRRLIDSQAGPSNPEATLMFLKSAFYYFLTDEANSQGHLNAIQSILGFSEMERQAVESHTYFRR